MNQDVTSVITLLETRIRQLLIRHAKLKEQLDKVQQQFEEQKEHTAALEEENRKLREDYSRLKAARLMDMADSDDLHETRKRINRLIASIDRCLATLRA